MDQIKGEGGLTAINVSAGYGESMTSEMSSAVTTGDGSSEQEQVNLDKANIALIEAIPNVEIVSPVLNFDILVKQGSYEGYLSLKGMNLDALKKMDIPLSEGRLPLEGSTEIEMVMGNQMIYNFYDTRSSTDYYDFENLPDIDFMHSPMFGIFDIDAYYNSFDGQEPMPKKYLVNTCGMVEGTPEEYNQHSYNVYVDIEALKFQLRKIFKSKLIPGQPTTPAGKPYKELIYQEAYVQVNEMENVKEVQSQIMDMGFQASSNIEFLEMMEEQSGIIQAVLGGIGGVSLFVAAIGIANTMMMSIYERTKEIGIIKVIGCSLSNIRSLFLLEAGFIGFLGGISGVGISYTISWFVNSLFGGDMYGMGTAANISYIPSWLALFGLSFAVLVGMIAGFFPALRAMKLSPLAAIRNQ